MEVALVSVLTPQEDLFFHCDDTPQPVSMRLYSGGSLPASGFEVGYRLNGGPWVMENFIGTMVPGTFGTHVFTTLAHRAARCLCLEVTSSETIRT
ncbi:MAG: hypothetical protein R2818_04250 [Flavobacteriales bacterium]